MSPIEGVVATLGVIFFVAFLVTSIVEAVFGQVFEQVAALKPYKWLQQYLAFGAGIGMAFVYGFDLIALLGQVLGQTIATTTAGIVSTGIGIGMGASWLHEAVKTYFIKPTVPA